MSSQPAMDLFLSDPAPATDTPPPRLRVHATRAKRLQMQRAARTDALRAAWPRPLEPGVAYHWLTAGDVDAGSFLALLMDEVGHAADLALSTWTMSREDVETLVAYLDEGRVDHLTVLTGEYFAQRETAVYATLLAAVTARPGRADLRKLRNHTKLITVRGAGHHLVCCSSANMTTNPRAEQHVVQDDPDLWQFYRGWIAEVVAAEPAP